MATTPEPPDEGPADRVMRAIRASYPGPPALSLADEIADCETRAAAGGPNAAAYARRAAELHELAGHSGIEGFWQLAVSLENADAAAYVRHHLCPIDGAPLAAKHMTSNQPTVFEHRDGTRHPDRTVDLPAVPAGVTTSPDDAAH